MAFIETRNGAWYALFVLLSCTPIQAQGSDLGDPPAAPASRPFLPRNSAVPNATAPNWYDIANRTIVRDSWNLTFAPTLSVPMGWSGDVALGNAGTTAQAFKDAVATRINWFRAMAGVPTGITLDPAYSAQDQQAAMMFSVNRQISHTPPSSWINYSAAGATAAGNSNICLGYTSDPGCVLAYIVDQGSNNAAAGHRRWILYPQTQVMGTGDVPQSGGGSNPYPPANALWVFDGNYGSARPGARDTYVAWPPPGFVPYQVVGPRWSFSYPNANFSGATVSMQRNGSPVPVRLETVANGYGENTLVWVPDNLDASNNNWHGVAPPSDTTSTVTIANVLISGVAQTFTYGVTVFDPASAPVGNFSFNPSSGTVPYTGGSGTANLTVSPFGTTWTASVTGNWLGITSGSTGNSSGPISWTASANPSSFGRTATIAAGGATYALTQPGTPCVYSLNQFSGALPVGGGSGSFVVAATPSDCAPSYSATGFLTVNSSSAPGAITFNYSAGPNGTGVNRTATVTVGGQVTLTVTQSGLACTFTIAPANAPVTSGGATGTVVVTASASTCPWSASSNASWITANSSATGNGTASYTAAPNPTPLQRTGTLFIAGQAFVLTQQPPVGTNTAAFVNQLYLDILSRTADPVGLNTWVGWIDSGLFTRAQVASQFSQSAEFSISGSYVTKLYLAIMLRDPDYEGWTGWFSYLRAGHSQTEILNQFLGSQEFQLRYGSLDNTAFVTLVYNNVLNRAPDPAGLAQWVAWLNGGTYSRAEVMNGFITSPEFDNRVRNRVYANMLYIGFLRRVGEAAGLDGWTTWLNAGTYSLDQAVGGFISSPEYLARF